MPFFLTVLNPVNVTKMSSGSKCNKPLFGNFGDWTVKDLVRRNRQERCITVSIKMVTKQDKKDLKYGKTGVHFAM